MGNFYRKGSTIYIDGYSNQSDLEMERVGAMYRLTLKMMDDVFVTHKQSIFVGGRALEGLKEFLNEGE